MKVFVTGATGLVGAHSARALLDAGHQVRLLVRDEGAARRYFEAHGHALDDVVVADLRESERVSAAMAGCDAVLHAAAVVSLDPRRARDIYTNNMDATRAVVGRACELGIGNIVYVSSLAAFFRPGATAIDEDSPLGEPKEAYARSKRDCDAYVRGLQQDGAPVQITYPAAVFGPDDPKLSESNHALLSFLTAMLPRTSSGMQCVDVRDIAQAHLHLLEHPRGDAPTAARYILGGHYYPWAELHRMLETITATRVFAPRLPGAMLRFMGAATDVLKAIVPFDTQVSLDAMSIATQWVPARSDRFIRHSGLAFRPGQQTFADTVRWLSLAGHLDHRRAGRLADPAIAPGAAR